jgi:phosphatidylserine/phosphatidylglycerophosphate/cardiolipin synthase-like enzyme
VDRLLRLGVILAAALLIAVPPASAAGWDPPSRLRGGAGEALGTAIATGTTGVAFAAWQESEGSGFAVYAARSTGGAWGRPQRISDAPATSVTVRIAAGRTGTAVATWRSSKGVQASTYNSGTGRWEAAVVVAGPGARSASVAVGSRGTPTIAWVAPDGDGAEVVRATRLRGNTWSAPVALSPAGSIADVRVAAGLPGEANVAWTRAIDGRGVIEVARGLNGAWSEPVAWSDPAADAASMRLAGGDDGELLAVWSEENDAGVQVISRRDAAGGLRAPTVQASYPSGTRVALMTAADSGGSRAALAWTTLVGDTATVTLRVREPQGWAPAHVIDGADSPQVALTSAGAVTLVYRVPTGDLDQIMALRGTAGVWSDAEQLGTTGASAGPRVAVGVNGTATVIWTEPVDGRDAVRVSRYRAQSSTTPHIDAVAAAIRTMEGRTGSDSTEGKLWQVTDGNALDGVGTAAAPWLVRTQDCWGQTEVCSSGAVQQRMLDTIRSIVANAETTVDVSSLAGVADGGFREALIAGVREADAAGRRPLVRLVWGHQPAAPFSKLTLKALYRDLTAAAPNLKIVVALHKNTLISNGFAWNHSKIVAADGEVAFASGINMWSASYLQSTNPVTDVGVVVRGPAAADAHRFLDVIWTELCTYPTWSLKHSNTLVPDKGGARCPAHRAPAATPAVGNIRVLAVGRAGYSKTGLASGTLDPNEVSQADRKDSGCMVPPLPNTMNGDPHWDGSNPSDTALRALVKSAKHKVVISQQEATFSCLRDPSYDVRLFDALARKVAAGIPVTIIVSNENGAISTLEGYSANPQNTVTVMHNRLRKLLGSDAAATKAACSSLTIDRFRYSNAATWPNGKEPALHGKVIAVDDAAFYVGSQNAYPNQLQEFGYIIEDPSAMADFRRDYLDPMVRYSSRAPLACDGAPSVPETWRTGVLDRIPPGTPVAVSMGDSFISGEAGRWRGNVGSAKNADLIDNGASAYWDTPTAESEAGCHRSKSAEIHISGITGVNIACSGAITTSKSNLAGLWKPGIDRGVSGTQKYGQLTLLDAVARQADVKLVALSIGGNDMGFSKVILACIGGFARPWPLNTTCEKSKSVNRRLADAALDQVGSKVQSAIERIDGTMRNAGYADADWTLIVQGYPLPLVAPLRYPETYKGRFTTGGCPFYDADLAWIATRIPVLNDALRKAAQRAAKATGHPVAFMDLEQALAGRELCAKSASLVDQRPEGPQRTADAERVSMLRIGNGFEPAEAIHPNALGQLAFQACLQQAWNAGAARSGRCAGPVDWSQTDPDGRPLVTFTAG